MSIALSRIEGLLTAYFAGLEDFEAMGPRILASYFLISALTSSNAHCFPIVCENPVGPLDVAYRVIAAHILSSSNNQFIGFISQHEREPFVTEIEKSGKTIRYFTLIGSDREIPQISPSIPDTGVTNSATGTLIEGREYFHAFEGFRYD